MSTPTAWMLAPADAQEALDRIVAERVATIGRRHGMHPTMRRIVNEIAAAAGIDPVLIVSRHGQQPIAELRHLAMWRAHAAGMSYSAIGRALDRDHTSVAHGVRAETDRQVREREIKCLIVRPAAAGIASCSTSAKKPASTHPASRAT